MFNSTLQGNPARNSSQDDNSLPFSSADEVLDTSPVSPECLINSLESKRTCAALYSAKHLGRVQYSTNITDSNGSSSEYLIEADQTGEPYEIDGKVCAKFEIVTTKVTEGNVTVRNPQGETGFLELCVPLPK